MITIYTDGACNQKEKIGGWSFSILEDGSEIFTDSGSENNTTNNQCEMLAAIKGMEALDKEQIVCGSNVIKIFSDSAYLVNAFSDDWIGKWTQNNWRNSTGQPVANQEFWQQLMSLQKKHRVEFIHMPRNNSFSNKVNKLAKKQVILSERILQQELGR